MTRAPLAPHRPRNWASPWATVMIWMLVQVDFGADLAGDAGDLVERQPVKVVTLAGERDQQVLLAWPAVRVPPQRWGRRSRAGSEQCQRCGWAGLSREGCAAGGDRAFLDHPAAEPGQRAGRRQAQAEQPQQA